MKKKWRAKTCLAAITALSALSMPLLSGMQAHATEDTAEAEPYEMAVVSVGGSGEVSDTGFFIPVTVENQSDHSVEVYIEDLAETNGGKLESSEKAVFEVGPQDVTSSGFTIPGKPRMVTGTVRLAVDGEEMDSEWIQFSDGTVSHSYLNTAVVEDISPAIIPGGDSADQSVAPCDDCGAEDEAVDPMFSESGSVVSGMSGGVVAVIVTAVIAVVCIPVVWLVIKKKKGRDE